MLPVDGDDRAYAEAVECLVEDWVSCLRWRYSTIDGMAPAAVARQIADDERQIGDMLRAACDEFDES